MKTNPTKKTDLLRNFVIQNGERHPKKHGSWYRIHAYENNWLVVDTWNSHIYHYPNGATPSDTNNMYGVVYVFYDKDGVVENCKGIKEHMAPFWLGHLKPKLK